MVLGNSQTILRLHMPKATDAEIQTSELSPWHVALKSALALASNSVKEITALIGLIAALTAAFYFYRDSLKLPGYWPELIIITTIALFIALFFLPSLRVEVRKYKLAQLGVHGALEGPEYFRLTAYEKDDAAFFKRPDGAAEALCAWVEATTRPLLYLTGQSGVGKSSLINAKLLPALASKDWVALNLRPHDSPLEQLQSALLLPGAIWSKPGKPPSDLYSLLCSAADRVRRDGKRLLIIIDQFEEALILCSTEQKNGVGLFLKRLNDDPLPGLVLVLSLRADYLNDLPAFGLPFAHFGPGENTFEVCPFSRAEGQRFLEASGLSLGPELLDHILAEAAQIEDMPLKVRPIVLNTFGLVVSKFSGNLPRNVQAGRLLTGYIEQTIRETRAPELALNILRVLTTDAGTKRCLTVAEIAQQVGVDPLAVRGCMLRLSKGGILRCLPGKPERWEVAHDFTARLLQPLLSRWPGLSKRARQVAVLLVMGVWLITVTAGVWAYPWLLDLHARARLAEIGIVQSVGKYSRIDDKIINLNTLEIHYEHNGKDINDTSIYKQQLSYLAKLRHSHIKLKLINILNDESLNFSDLREFPAVHNLSSLELSFRSLDSLHGMPILPMLESIYIASDNMTDFTSLPPNPSTRFIEFHGEKLRNLSGIEGQTNLSSLKLSVSPYFSGPSEDRYSIGPFHLAGICKINNLETLDFYSLRGVIGLHELSRCKDLRNLYLKLSSLKLSEIRDLLSLVKLELSYANFYNLEDFPDLPNLESLELSNNDTKSLYGMPVLNNLKELTIRDMDIMNLNYMPNHPNLVKLDLGFKWHRYYQSRVDSFSLDDTPKRLFELSGLPPLQNLEVLDLSYREIHSLDGIPHLPNLKSLTIVGTEINSLRGLKPSRHKIKIVTERGRKLDVDQLADFVEIVIDESEPPKIEIVLDPSATVTPPPPSTR